MPLVYDKALYDAHYRVPAWPYGMRWPDGNASTKPRHHYNWWVQAGMPRYARLRNHASVLINGPGWASLTDIAIIGGGFGWTAEPLLEAKPTLNIINVETSPYVINSLAQSEEADIRQYLIDDGFDPDNLPMSFMSPNDPNVELADGEIWNYWLRTDGQRTSITTLDNDLSTNGQRNQVRQALSNNVDALITEIALDAHTTETEIDNFLDFVEQTRPNPACAVIHMISYAPGMFEQWGYISKTRADWATYLDTRGYGDHWILETSGAYQRADGAGA